MSMASTAPSSTSKPSWREVSRLYSADRYVLIVRAKLAWNPKSQHWRQKVVIDNESCRQKPWYSLRQFTHIDHIGHIVDIVLGHQSVGGSQIEQIVVAGFCAFELVFRVLCLSLGRTRKTVTCVLLWLCVSLLLQVHHQHVYGQVHQPSLSFSPSSSQSSVAVDVRRGRNAVNCC